MSTDEDSTSYGQIAYEAADSYNDWQRLPNYDREKWERAARAVAKAALSAVLVPRTECEPPPFPIVRLVERDACLPVSPVARVGDYVTGDAPYDHVLPGTIK